MSKLHRRLCSLPPGTRVLTGSKRSLWPDLQPVDVGFATEGLRISTIKESTREQVVLTAEDGTERVEPLDRDGKPTDWRLNLLWTDALPAGPPEAAKAYAAVLLAGEGKALLLHVESIEGGRATCRLVQPASLQQPHEAGVLAVVPDEDAETWSGEIVGNAALWAHPIVVEMPKDMPYGQPATAPAASPVEAPTWRVGDLIGAVGQRCGIEDGITLTRLKGPLRIGNLTRPELGRFMPWGVTEADVPLDDTLRNRCALARYSGPAGFEEHRDEEEIAWVSLEPNEALVVWYRPVGNDPSSDETACSFMGMSGITFHRIDAVEDYFPGAGIEEGLWILRKAKGWSDRSYEGEYDSGIDGDWEPATVADLERFGYTLDSASAEIADRIEVDPTPGLAAELIAKAEAAAEASRQTAPSM